ncbi:PAS domain S-box-containing protein [Malonomonas rubra DSM 5091]|uniref:histidine kinase n=1 Tax=Malonomonas rubra DSM 5091 TaxID=1122189 RepID=A0A1M6L7W0_MALRU|nr:ATP-binding protein [Malonomonas rubra]SHJ67119.1 PAS domain S-box-containing protein [Malonomonas rubra DSM 5091]
MPEDKLQPPIRKRLKLQILLPMALGLFIFLGLYIISTSWYLDREIERGLEQEVSKIEFDLKTLLHQQTDVMLAQLEQIAESKELQQLMQQQDRAGLFNATEREFQRLLERLRISHYYFHTPEQKVFLRVHNPQRHGDLITRYTLQRAAATGKPFSGIELGPLGTFTLRTVLPWYQGEKLLGYLELGEEVELLLNNYFQHEGSLTTITINKRHLDRKLWEEGVTMLGKDPVTWDLLPGKVVTQTSKPELLPDVILALLYNQDIDGNIKLKTATSTYLGKARPLLDASGQRVGDFFILQDVTVTITEFWKTVLGFSAVCVAAAGVLLMFSTGVLNKVEKQQQTSDQQLVDGMIKVNRTNQLLEKEVEERKAAEAALNKIHSELEERVNERTEQLWLSLEQTQQIRKQLTDIVTSVPDGLIVVDIDQNILLVNQRAEELFQCSLDDCTNQPLSSIIRDPSILKKMVEALQQQLNDLRFDVMQISSDLHNPISLQIRTSILTDRQGKTIGMIYLIHDISQEREIERMKSEFITTAVHELSTPLTAVLGYSEFLLENPDVTEAEKQEFLTIINEKADFLSGLVGELLDISRIESGKPLSLQKDVYSVKDLFERPIQHLKLLSTDHNFIIELAAEETKLLVDKEKIWQVMENLCSNAVKYSPSAGDVKITGQAMENSYRVTVSDQGIGLTKDQTVKVFEKFYRCNQTDTSVGGTGLGLTIVKYIIESHDGQIWIDSELGQGTQVHFVLPIHNA